VSVLRRQHLTEAETRRDRAGRASTTLPLTRRQATEGGGTIRISNAAGRSLFPSSLLRGSASGLHGFAGRDEEGVRGVALRGLRLPVPVPFAAPRGAFRGRRDPGRSARQQPRPGGRGEIRPRSTGRQAASPRQPRLRATAAHLHGQEAAFLQEPAPGSPCRRRSSSSEEQRWREAAGAAAEAVPESLVHRGGGAQEDEGPDGSQEQRQQRQHADARHGAAQRAGAPGADQGAGGRDRRAPPAAREQGPGGGAAQGPVPSAAGRDQDAQRRRPVPGRGAGAGARPPPPGRDFHAHRPDPVPRAGARPGSFFPCHDLAACYLLLRLGC
jgi:hypothetical protein